MFRQEAGPIGVNQRPRRVAAGSPSSESFKEKLDPRLARFAVGATLVAAGVISFARPTINTVARFEPKLSPAISTPAPEDIDDYACDMRDYLVPNCDDSSSPVINRYCSPDDDTILCKNFDEIHGGG